MLNISQKSSSYQKWHTFIKYVYMKCLSGVTIAVSTRYYNIIEWVCSHKRVICLLDCLSLLNILHSTDIFGFLFWGWRTIEKAILLITSDLAFLNHPVSNLQEMEDQFGYTPWREALGRYAQYSVVYLTSPNHIPPNMSVLHVGNLEAQWFLYEASGIFEAEQWKAG